MCAPRRSYIFQVSPKSVQGFWNPRGIEIWPCPLLWLLDFTTARKPWCQWMFRTKRTNHHSAPRWRTVAILKKKHKSPHLTRSDYHRLNVAWNNSFRRIFGCCWRESVACLQFYCHTLPMAYMIDQRKILFWKKVLMCGVRYSGCSHTGYT